MLRELGKVRDCSNVEAFLAALLAPVVEDLSEGLEGHSAQVTSLIQQVPGEQLAFLKVACYKIRFARAGGGGVKSSVRATFKKLQLDYMFRWG